MINRVQIVPISEFRLFVLVVRKKVYLSKRGVGTFYRSAAKERDRENSSHTKYRGVLKLRRSVGEVKELRQIETDSVP